MKLASYADTPFSPAGRDGVGGTKDSSLVLRCNPITIYVPFLTETLASFLLTKKNMKGYDPRGDFHMEQTGMLVGNFEFNP